MPTLCTFENLNRTSWPSQESIASSISGQSSPLFSTSPGSPQLISTSPVNTLTGYKKQRKMMSAKSEPFTIQSECRISRSQSPILTDLQEDQTSSKLAEIIGWYPCFLLRLLKTLIVILMPESWFQLVLIIPKLYANFWIWILRQIVCLPITVIKFFFLVDVKNGKSTRKRTVLISGGSTIQALHLARNFHSAGARVVVCEIDGLFALARFSTAVSKFYTVPKPTSDQQQNYVRALCDIVDKEHAVYYVPVSASTSAYFDAVAKPHLELLGCNVFCPGIKEVWALDDTLEMLKKCQKFDIPTPTFHELRSADDLDKLYELNGPAMLSGYTLSTAGPSGLRERVKFKLPANKSELKCLEISEQRPWVAIQQNYAETYLTCTTVKKSSVIANVTCRLDQKTNGLVPVHNQQVNQWLTNFFGRLNLLRPITGHVSFRFGLAEDANGDSVLVPLSSRVGVSLPYICYTSVHPRLLWKPCKHFSRQNSGVLLINLAEPRTPSDRERENNNVENDVVTRLIGTVLDKREVLFLMWDPMPYCAYYHMQIPFKNVLPFIQRKQENFPRTITNPVR